MAVPRTYSALLLIALLCLASCKKDDRLNGYVEGEFVRIGPSTGGFLKTLSVERGATVEAGADLFSIDLTTLTAERDAAKAALTQAQANFADLTKGKRPDEIAVIISQKAEAAADLDAATKEFTRSDALAQKDATSVKQRDEDKAAFERDTARVAELEAQLKVAGLAGREDQLAAAKAAIDAAQQKLAQTERALIEAAPKSPAAGQIEDTFYRPGEFVTPGSPVVSLLPPENVKIRFFVPQKTLPALKLGDKITVTCDGCKGPVTADINFMSNQAEFTPPVIYSVELRDKLVFLIEAKPEAFDPALRPGLPVDIALGTAQQ